MISGSGWGNDRETFMHERPCLASHAGEGMPEIQRRDESRIYDLRMFLTVIFFLKELLSTHPPEAARRNQAFRFWSR